MSKSYQTLQFLSRSIYLARSFHLFEVIGIAKLLTKGNLFYAYWMIRYENGKPFIEMK